MNKKMKYVILIGDGMGDYPMAELHGKTPLEVSRTPTMDFLAGQGELAVLRTVPEGYPPGSDVANLSLMGYLPQECYTGRAPLEAASMGVELSDDGPDVAFRCNLVTLDLKSDNDVTMVDYSGGHISTKEAGELIMSLEQALGSERIRFYPGISYRHLMVHKGKIEGLETVPPHDHTGRQVSEYWNRYMAFPHIKAIVKEACRILSSHEINNARIKKGLNPANAIWLWGEGTAPTMSTLSEQYGVSGALISAVDLLKGIGIYAGMEIINVAGATGYLDTNYAGKANAALEALKKKDFVLVHVEAPDEAGHQGLLKEKIQAIEDFDLKIVKPILKGLNDAGIDFKMIIAMDHFTPISLKTHVSDPVPLIMFDSGQTDKKDGPLYHEKNAVNVPFFENGREFFKHFLKGKVS